MTASMLQSGLLAELPSGESRGALVLPGSVAEVYEAHARYVFRCLRSLGVRDAHLDDAVQDVFLVVNDKLGSFDGKAKLRTWLYAIVINIARRYRGRQASEAREPSHEPTDPCSAEDTFLSRERLRLAHTALAGLSDDKREVFVLAEIEQMSAAEIALVTFTPLNTVYSRLRAARAEFERRIELLMLRTETHPSRRIP